MSNVLNLTKINLINTFKDMFGKSKKKNSRLGTGSLILLIVALMLFSFGAMFYPIIESLSPSGAGHYVFLFAGIIAFALILFITVYEGQSHFFNTKDFELLASLPLKNYEIVLSKFFSVLITAYFYELVVLLPATVLFFVFSPFNILCLLAVLLGLIIFPIIPVAVGLLIGLLISFISSRSSHSNIFRIILTFVFLIAYLVAYSQMQSLVSYIMLNGQNVLSSIVYYLPNVSLFITGCVLLNGIHILILVGVSAIVLALSLLLLIMLYKNINFALLKTNTKVDKSAISYKPKSVFSSLLKKEWKKYISSPIWVTNSAFGLILMLVVPFGIKYGLVDVASSGININSVVIIIMAMLMMATLSNTTSSSISMEGKNFYILKNLPISIKDVFFSKMLINILIVAPFLVVTDICSIVLFWHELNVLNTIMLIVLPIIAICAYSAFGLLINLKYPKLEFDNVAMVVKQSTSAMIVIMSSMLLGMALIGISFVALPVWAVLTIATVIYSTILIISAILLKTHGKKLFEKID